LQLPLKQHKKEKREMKKIIFGILLAVFAAFASYAQDRPYVNEACFHYIDVYHLECIHGEFVGSGWVEILDYTGSNRAITIPSSLMGESTRIGKEAFFDKQLTSVTIPNGITVIGQGAFHTNLLTAK
jgi:hypothetical protein